MKRNIRRKVVIASLAALIVAACGASAAAGAAPTVLRFTVDETFADDVLTQACGFPVQTTVKGVVIFRIFEQTGATGVVGVISSDIGATAMAGGNTYRLPRSAGVDLLLLLPSGLYDIVAGQQFELAGVTISNVITGDVLVAPHHSTSVATADICAALAA